MQSQDEWYLTTDGGCVTRAVEHVQIQFVGSFQKSYLFPKRIEVSANFQNVHILGILQTSVITRSNEYEVFIPCIYLLKLANLLQHHIVHAVLILAEDSLGFNTDSHICLMIFAGTPATSEWGGTSLVTTAPAATTE